MTNAGCGVLTAPLLACIACIHFQLLGVQTNKYNYDNNNNKNNDEIAFQFMMS